MKKYRYILGLLLAVLWACSNGELEGDLYPVALDKGGKEDNSSMEAVVKGIKENMIYLNGGLFTMGATSEQQDEALENEYPARYASVGDFRLCRYEMTQREWNTIAAWGGYRQVDFSVKGGDLPVTDVTYEMCLDIIDILNRYTGLEFRLPTEEEWEYAARKNSPYGEGKYAGGDRLYRLGWYEDNSGGKPHPVGEKEPNAAGFYDMSGNVAEWCSSYYTENYDPGSAVSRTKRVGRGGSYDLEAKYCRVSTRIPVPADETAYDLGLRLAVDKLYDIQLDSYYEEFDAGGGVREIEMKTDGELVQCVSTESWCKVVKSGDKLIITVEKNEGILLREAKISVWAGDENWDGKVEIRIRQEGRPVKVGDVYDRDGVKGVIYEVSNDGLRGKIVSLAQITEIWSSRYTSSNGRTYANSMDDGEANMQTIRNCIFMFEFPAFKWCYDYDSDHQWYLPAHNELSDMFKAIRTFGTSEFDQVLTDNGGESLSSASAYWSSTEYDHEWAYGMDRGGSVRHSLHKNTTLCVRAIRKVTFD